jgi:predicted transcriptional regulator
MIKEILKLMSSGNLTINEIAQKMNLSKDELLNRFKMMEQMGYLKRADKAESETKSHGTSKTCTFCPEAKSCSSNKRTSYEGLTYSLTEKGKNLAGL